MTEKKVLVFPLLKRYEEREIGEEPSKDDIDSLAFYYTSQLAQHFFNLGFSQTTEFFKDLDFIQASIRAVLMRNAGKYDSLQDKIDEIMDDIE